MGGNVGELLELPVGALQLGDGLPQPFFGFHESVDIGACAKPLYNLTVFTQDRHAPDQPPVVHSIPSAQPALERIGTIVFHGVLPGIPCTLLVIRVEGLVPAMTVAFFHSEPRVIHPLLVEIGVPAICTGDPHNLGHCLGEEAKFLFTAEKRIFRFLLDGDIPGGGEDPFHLPLLVGEE